MESPSNWKYNTFFECQFVSENGVGNVGNKQKQRSSLEYWIDCTTFHMGGENVHKENKNSCAGTEQKG